MFLVKYLSVTAHRYAKKRRLQPDKETYHGWFFVEYVQFLKPGECVYGVFFTKRVALSSCNKAMAGRRTQTVAVKSEHRVILPGADIWPGKDRKASGCRFVSDMSY